MNDKTRKYWRSFDELNQTEAYEAEVKNEFQDELDVYNALVPDGANWKATFMIEYGDVDERRAALARLRGVDRAIWVQVADFDKVRPIANEDLDRETPDKTASVHFLRFEFTAPMIAAMKAGASIRAGIDHPACMVETEIVGAVRESLVGDFS